jgi:NADH dehydrogenase FAD-containing subunit
MQLSSRRKKIVILGGGCGGVVAATQLGRKLGADHDVILVDRRRIIFSCRRFCLS